MSDPKKPTEAREDEEEVSLAALRRKAADSDDEEVSATEVSCHFRIKMSFPPGFQDQKLQILSHGFWISFGSWKRNSPRLRFSPRIAILDSILAFSILSSMHSHRFRVQPNIFSPILRLGAQQTQKEQLALLAAQDKPNASPTRQQSSNGPNGTQFHILRQLIQIGKFCNHRAGSSSITSRVCTTAIAFRLFLPANEFYPRNMHRHYAVHDCDLSQFSRFISRGKSRRFVVRLLPSSFWVCSCFWVAEPFHSANSLHECF
jgi:hypothetical protein